MRRIVLWLMSTLTVVVLLFGYRTSTNSAPAAAASSAIAPYTGTTTAPSSATTSSSAAGNSVTAPAAGTSSGSTSGSTTSSAAPPSTTAADATYTGDTASTRWGDVQVAITVSGGQITAVSVPVYPTGNQKDQQINARALPVLVQETVSAQSADIDMVSGATVTSEGYVESLQSARDQAGL
jgi:uncharacterized protein with FMN-binding domain